MVNVTTLAEIAGIICVVVGGFLARVPAGLVAVRAALLGAAALRWLRRTYFPQAPRPTARTL